MSQQEFVSLVVWLLAGAVALYVGFLALCAALYLLAAASVIWQTTLILVVVGGFVGGGSGAVAGLIVGGVFGAIAHAWGVKAPWLRRTERSHGTPPGGGRAR